MLISFGLLTERDAKEADASTTMSEVYGLSPLSFGIRRTHDLYKLIRDLDAYNTCNFAEL
jgi:hypothetical protein